MKTQVELLISCLLIFIPQVFAQTPVEKNGKLQVIGHQLCNEHGNPIQLKGMGMFGIMHFPECITYDGLKTLKNDWNANVMRLPVIVADYSNTKDYNTNPQWNKNIIDSVVTWTEEFGMYCIIDWHVLKVGNPNDPEHSGADAFFEEMSLKYKNKKHVLYEICNEPNGVTWSIVANYANRMIPIIHSNDPDAIIIVGSTGWASEIEKVDPTKLVDTKNVLYAFHFYAASHGHKYDILMECLHKIPVFVSEWGVGDYTGDGFFDKTTSDKFLKAFEKHISNNDTVTISWCNFSYADKDETASALKPGSCSSELWNNTTTEGEYLKKWIQGGATPTRPKKTIKERTDLSYEVFPTAQNNMIKITNAENGAVVSVISLNGEVLCRHTIQSQADVVYVGRQSKGAFVITMQFGNSIKSEMLLLK
jgi:aryl-phospho-beta-D-glucosidase BglC (GH1 family)